ncbi:hypothetical protein JOD82_002309 [Paenibacillus sp. 1182]|uniref:hypothetical protein n=1 Tax=Paenibacillus sp. 1182 TaxID=2806565 RepID=UPI001AE71891|nr:hypothetical protein [Paenibacillus sp. 1182]MBP1309289.1 hypothetical protein [Paenibacillus sp. 1182]
MNDNGHSYGIGDYVYVQYGIDQECPGVIREKNNNDFVVEIRIKKKTNKGNDVDRVDCKIGQLRPMY